VVVSFIAGGNWSTQIKPLLISNDFLYFSGWSISTHFPFGSELQISTLLLLSLRLSISWCKFCIGVGLSLFIFLSELAEYTLNNQNTTFPPENESDDIESLENESDLSCDKNNISNDSGVAVDLFNGNSVGEKSIDVIVFIT
jgi:hypothetical protein